ncbi:hypothetical protein PG984_011426 [Apiospora sp. TS-2023a]
MTLPRSPAQEAQWARSRLWDILPKKKVHWVGPFASRYSLYEARVFRLADPGGVCNEAPAIFKTVRFFDRYDLPDEVVSSLRRVQKAAAKTDILPMQFLKLGVLNMWLPIKNGTVVLLMRALARYVWCNEQRLPSTCASETHFEHHVVNSYADHDTEVSEH